MKILFVISSLRSGGAERVLTTLANDLIRRGFDIEVLTFGSKSSDFYTLDERIRRTEFDLLRPSTSRWESVQLNFEIVSRLRRRVKEVNPDVVVSFMDVTNIVSCLAVIGLGIKLIVSERSDPFLQRLSPIREFVRPLLYKFYADKVVVQTESVAAKVREHWNGVVPHVIPNPISTDFETILKPLRKNVVLCVGRIDDNKAQEVAIRAFSSVLPEYPDWELRIAGEGPKKQSLIMLSRELGVDSRVKFLGAVKDIRSQYLEASVFLMTSRYEGFPNALLEAAASGCACIASDCPSGPREILFTDNMGVLVPVDDVVKFSLSIRKLLSSNECRSELQSAALKVHEKFSRSVVMEMWIRLFC